MDSVLSSTVNRQIDRETARGLEMFLTPGLYAVSVEGSSMRKHGSLSSVLLGALFGFTILSLTATAQTNLGSVNIGSSTTSTVTVTLPSAATLTSIAVVTQGAPNLDFTNAGGGTCATGTPYAANVTCTVQVTFAPRFAGTRYGAVVLSNTSGVVATAYLQGTGAGPQATFTPGAGA